jgi:hypothetical protein
MVSESNTLTLPNSTSLGAVLVDPLKWLNRKRVSSPTRRILHLCLIRKPSLFWSLACKKKKKKKKKKHV